MYVGREFWMSYVPADLFFYRTYLSPNSAVARHVIPLSREMWSSVQVYKGLQDEKKNAKCPTEAMWGEAYASRSVYSPNRRSFLPAHTDIEERSRDPRHFRGVHVTQKSRRRTQSTSRFPHRAAQLGKHSFISFLSHCRLLILIRSRNCLSPTESAPTKEQAGIYCSTSRQKLAYVK